MTYVRSFYITICAKLYVWHFRLANGFICLYKYIFAKSLSLFKWTLELASKLMQNQKKFSNHKYWHFRIRKDCAIIICKQTSLTSLTSKKRRLRERLHSKLFFIRMDATNSSLFSSYNIEQRKALRYCS